MSIFYNDRLEREELATEIRQEFLLRKIAHTCIDIRGILAFIGNKFLPTNAEITQGDSMLTGKITGLVPGASDTFFSTPVDANGNADALPAGSPIPSFSADDTTVTVATSADGLSAVVGAATTAAPGGSFNLTWAATFTRLDGSAGSISKTVQVPYLAPPALDPVDAVISQGSPAV